MMSSVTRPISRRLAAGAMLATAAGLALPLETLAVVIIQRGITGGGYLQLERGEATFSLFASRMIFDEEKREVILGRVLWEDMPNGPKLTSTRITDYEVRDSDVGEARRIRGFMTVGDDARELPFTLDVVDVAFPGAGQDTVVLTVGDGAGTAEPGTPVPSYGYSYTASGILNAGDIEDVDFTVESATGRPVAATPQAG
jgi:hypothetical protein